MGLHRLSTDLYLSTKPNSGEPIQQWYQREAYEIIKLTQLERIESELKHRDMNFLRFSLEK